MTDSVVVSLGSFTDFAVAQGLARPRLTEGLYQMYTDPDRQPWNFYQPFDQALSRGIATGQLDAELDKALSTASERQAPHFRALAAGAKRVFPALGLVSITSPPRRTWRHRGLEVKVRPHVTAHTKDNGGLALFMYHKEAKLLPSVAEIPLHIAREAGFSLDKGFTPIVIDLRAGRVFRGSTRANSRRVSSFVQAEAEAFVTYWNLAAAS